MAHNRNQVRSRIVFEKDPARTQPLLLGMEVVGLLPGCEIDGLTDGAPFFLNPYANLKGGGGVTVRSSRFCEFHLGPSIVGRSRHSKRLSVRFGIWILCEKIVQLEPPLIERIINGEVSWICLWYMFGMMVRIL